MTIKMRLALLFTFLVALILGGFSWTIYWFAAYQRSEVFFSELKVNAIATATIVLRSDNLSDSLLEPYRKKILNKLPFESIDIFNLDRESVFHQGEHTLALSEEEKRKALETGIYRKSGSDYQAICFPFHDEEKQYLVFISAVDERGLKTMAELRWGLLVGYVTSLIIVFAAGRWFASKAIAPLARITRQAEGISATDLHVRVDLGGQRDELYDLARAFNGMLDRLEKTFHSQKQFIANASHELRTPLTTMEGLMEVALMNRREEKEYRLTLSTALEEMRALRFTTNNLLLLTRAKSDVMVEDLRTHRIDDILFAAIDAAKRRHPDRLVELEYTRIPEEESSLLIKGNDDLLRNAFLNLLENAFKYSQPDSSVRVSLEANKSRLTLSITDRGLGIVPEDMPKIFDPFFRSQRTHSIPGSGIGLTLVRAILERHSGTIAFDSTPGKGTTVQVTLPMAA